MYCQGLEIDDSVLSETGDRCCTVRDWRWMLQCQGLEIDVLSRTRDRCCSLRLEIDVVSGTRDRCTLKN